MKVLHADDDSAWRTRIGELLRELECEVTSVNDGDEIVRLIVGEGQRFDLIISDVEMDWMSGPSALLRVEAHLNGTPFVFLSGMTEFAINQGWPDVLGRARLIRKSRCRDDITAIISEFKVK